MVLIGHGISYSASPLMQQAAFAAAGLDWSYELADVAPADLTRAVAGLRSESVAGANVTIPHKVAVIALLDRLEGDAEPAGAVNTIRRDGARLVGSNTDVVAIRSVLGALGVIPGPGVRAVILGGGGSARAAARALAGARLTVVARRPEAVGIDAQVVAWSEPSWHGEARKAQLLVNATPLGRAGELPVDPEALPEAGAVIDLVYVQGGTPLARAARLRGLRCADGWEVLLAQGAASFEAWTGRPAPVEAMRAALPA